MKLKVFILTVSCVVLVVGTCCAGGEILPEITTRIELSRSDINRIHCSQSQIGDVLFSEEKGIEVKIHGQDAFLKFTVRNTNDGKQYKADPAELYVVCGESMYMMIAEPREIPAVTIRLSSSLKNRIEETRDFFKGLALEEKNMKLIKHAYTDTLPDYFRVTYVAEDIGIFKEIRLMLIKTVRVEGEGIVLKEFVLRNETEHDLHIQEEDFLIKEITNNARALSLEPQELKSGEKGRLFIIERIKEDGNLLLF